MVSGLGGHGTHVKSYGEDGLISKAGHHTTCLFPFTASPSVGKDPWGG